MITARTSTAALVAAMIALTVMACGSAASPSNATRDPIHMTQGGQTGNFFSGIAPGSPLAWSVRIQNDAGDAAIVDGYELADMSAALQVVGATAVPSTWLFSACNTKLQVNADLRSAVAGQPLVGSSIGPTSASPWASGGCLIFIFQAPSANDYSLSGVRLRYHVGTETFETDIPASLEVCVGATVPPGSLCPFGSPRPSL
jgi:hypothetical protein